MGTHLIPREVEGEGRILIIFSMKGFVGTLVGIGIGAFFKWLFTLVHADIIGWIFLVICALIGFIIGQVKLPMSNSFDLFKKVGAEVVSAAFIIEICELGGAKKIEETGVEVVSMLKF